MGLSHFVGTVPYMKAMWIIKSVEVEEVREDGCMIWIHLKLPN